MHKLPVVLGASLLLAATASAQVQNPTIKNAVATSATQVFAQFSVALTTATGAPHLDVTRIRLLPDDVTPTSILQNPLNRGDFSITFASVPVTATRICFDQVQFQTADGVRASSAPVCADLSRDVDGLKETWLAVFEKVPANARDKTLFASGFVTAASDQSSGGADISLNPKFAPNVNAFLQIKKATADEGDARHFEAGANYRYTQPWKRGQLSTIAAENDRQTLNELIRERQTNLLAGSLIDVAGKLEGDPTEFAVTNFVGEGSFRVQTMTKGFLGRRGFWRGFVLPAGVEVGQSLGSATPSTAPPAEGEAPAAPAAPLDVNRIARYKAGAGFTAYYDNPAAQLPVRRVEFEITGVLRHLFERESRFNTETKNTDTTDDGLHGYAQAALKVFFGQTSAGMFGFKLSYNRGRLPPVYAEVNSFEFGFVIESGGNDGQPAEP